jgi:hypothetical protein
VASNFTPSGDSSTAHASTSASAKPIATSRISTRMTQAGASKDGNTIEATWSASQATIR